VETYDQESERLADEAREPDQDSDEDEEYFNPLAVPAAEDGCARWLSHGLAGHRPLLPVTPTEKDLSTGDLVATTAMGVKYVYRSHTAMGTPIAPCGYPGETVEQEVTRKRQREKDGTWGIYPNKWCGVRRCDNVYCTHIAR
jgi:hypothetical protein